MTTAAVTRVIEAVAQYFSTTTEDVLSRDRHKSVALARQVAMYVIREHQKPQPSFPEIGRLFGNRDHTTVMHAVRHVVRIAADDEVVQGAIEAGRDALALTFADGDQARYLAKCARKRALERELRSIEAELGDEEDHSGVRTSDVKGRPYLEVAETIER